MPQVNRLDGIRRVRRHWTASVLASWRHHVRRLDMDLFMFDVDANGKAVRAIPVPYRVRLERMDD